MKKLSLLLHITTLLFVVSSLAQGTQTKQTPPASQLSPEEIIRRFTEKESELREVWINYTYQQETKFQELGPAKTISGEFYQVSEFVFDDAGKRIERILKAPLPTLRLSMTSEDRNALINLQPFALTKEELTNYKVTYVGKEKLDDLNTYVFDVIPKAVSDQRELKRLKDQKIEGKYFQGRIWVDDQDLQIVKTAGKVVPEFKQQFPKFETYRENIDGRHWFPTYTFGEDTLFNIPVRLVVRYKNYRQFSGDIKFKVVDEVTGDEIKEKAPEKAPDEGKKADPGKAAEPNKTAKPEEKATDKKPAPPANPRPPKKP
jgi:hypothetical protein